MATLDRQLPSLDTFLCKPWSIFTDAAESLYHDSKSILRFCFQCLIHVLHLLSTVFFN